MSRDAEARAQAQRIVDQAMRIVAPQFAPHPVPERPASDWWFVHAGGTVDVPDTAEVDGSRAWSTWAALFHTVQVANLYRRPTLFRADGQEAVLISRDLFDELTAGRPEWVPPTFTTPDAGEGF